MRSQRNVGWHSRASRVGGNFLGEVEQPTPAGPRTISRTLRRAVRGPFRGPWFFILPSGFLSENADSGGDQFVMRVGVSPSVRDLGVICERHLSRCVEVTKEQ